ncbi:MAG TPA: hypothetical protein VIK72_13690 [Clostridiaceae bacterium]
MKIVAKEIEMVSWTDTKGVITPVRFRIANEDESVSVIKIDKVITVDKEKLAGNNMLVYKCKSVISAIERLFEIKYEISTCKWILWKL